MQGKSQLSSLYTLSLDYVMPMYCFLLSKHQNIKAHLKTYLELMNFCNASELWFSG